MRVILARANSAKVMLEKVWLLDPNIQSKVHVLLWDWWGERNKANAGEKRRTTEAVVFLVQLHITEFQSLLEKKSEAPSRVRKVCAPPEHSFLKINSDAPFNPETKSGGWGC